MASIGPVSLSLPLSVSAFSYRSLVQVSSGVRVLRGRSVSITESDSKIQVDPGSSCKVEVVSNEPVTQRVGKLTPQMFDCSFSKDEVQYVHNGSPSSDEDTVMLRVYWFTSSDTQVETVVLRVQVVDGGSSVVESGSAPSVVPRFFGSSNTINGSVSSIRTPDDVVCTIRSMTAETKVPTVGRSVREEDSGLRRGRQVEELCPGNKPCLQSPTEVQFLKTSCQDFSRSGSKYQHLSPPSPQTDYIPIRVESREQATRKSSEAQALWLPVSIHGAMPNQPPKAGFMASFISEVDQFILTPLSTASSDATDAETPQDRSVFNVTAPPAESYITHSDKHTKPIRSFTWSDSRDMKVAYQPPNRCQSLRQNSEVEFQAIDGSFSSSPPISVHSSIRPSETDAPRVSWNTGSDSSEGQSRPITWEESQVVDKDNMDAVYSVAVDGPAHGRLSVRGGKAFMFHVRDSKEGVVIYHHSDSDSTRDHIIFRISDGRHSIRHKFPINISPKDDSPPFLINNVAVEVEEGGAVRSQEYMSSASDSDSNDDFILYQIVSSPRVGQLVRKSSAHKTGVPVDSFLQKNSIQGQIYYQHSGDEVFEDSFDVRLSDSHQPPNSSQTYTVVVQVFPVKDQVPVEVSGTVRSSTVRETEVVHISQSQSHFTDRENPEADLTYVITQPCFSPSQTGSMDAGRSFYTDSTTSMKKDHMVPGSKSFTQHAVNHMKVAFMPPVEDIGPAPLFVQFVFSVSDPQGGTVSGSVFNITVTPVDNLPPEAFTNSSRVEEGGGAFVTEEHLSVQDRDSPEGTSRVEVQRTGRHGRLESSGGVSPQGGVFRSADSRGSRLRYVHDDSETTEDEVVSKATDGQNSVEIVSQIQVSPVNDEPPRSDAGSRGASSCEEGGRVSSTVDYSSASDRDSDDSRSTYMLARSPGMGESQRAGERTEKFSQQDSSQGHVYYVHSGTEIGPEPVLDTVTLIVSDGEAGGTDGCCHGDAPPPPVPSHGSLPVYDSNITVLPVNNKVPEIISGASSSSVDEGSRACSCGGVLGASDPDSPPEESTFHSEAPPLHGFSEDVQPTAGSEKSGAGIRIESFSLAHSTSRLINYVQSEHRGVEPTVDQMSIRVSDGLYSSAPVPVYIIINPTNDEPPSSSLANFTVEEGGVRESTPPISDASDSDAPPDLLTFRVDRPPCHGRSIYAQSGEVGDVQVSFFTSQDLRRGMKILYHHDDSETSEDAVLSQSTDGVHSVEKTAWVTVSPVNDNEPHSVRNAGSVSDSGERRVISSVVSEAVDSDTPPDRIFFFISAAPRFGELSSKTESNWTESSAGQNFTQEQVETNRSWYHHRTSGTGFRGHDNFRFVSSDVDQESSSGTFFLSIRSADPGEIVSRTGAVRSSEGQRVVSDTDVSSASDSAGRPEESVFTVSVPPRHGSVHAVRRPGVPSTRFTQSDVAASRVAYTHSDERHADSDTFSFVVTNGASSRSGVLLFTIKHGDRIPPTSSANAGLRSQDGATAIVTPDSSQLTDPDTPTSNSTYSVTSSPRNGESSSRGEPLATPPRFFQTDVDHQDSAYRHSPGSPAGSDRFHFSPTDGTNKGYSEFGRLREEPAVFSIQVDQLDRMSPSSRRSQAPSTVVDLGAGRYGIFITNRNSQGSDPDSPAESSEFSIIDPPRFGSSENVATGAAIIGRFTQQDVDLRSVFYLLPVDSDVTADWFRFRSLDPAGNEGPAQVSEMFWSRVQLSASCYRTCESSGRSQIQIQRSGKSADPAYVSIQVEEGTAKPGRDFTTSSAASIQFDTGVSVKTWNVYSVDDGSEENQETFSITLKNPQNAIMGQRRSASVEIVDARKGRCDPEDLKIDLPPPPSHPVPRPPPEEEEDEDRVTEIDAELLWENQPHPLRGDVPHRRPYSDYGEVEPQDQAVPGDSSGGRTGDRDAGKAVDSISSLCPEGWTFYRRRCLMVSSSVASWASAARTCSSLFNSSSSMARSRKDLSWMWRFTGRKSFWIGGSGGPDRWMWADGHPARLRGAPLGREEAGVSSDCVSVENPGRWRSTNCSAEDQHAFICSSETVPR